MSAETPRPQRLGRLETVFVRSPIYFVTACTANRHKILARAAIYESFIEFGKSGPEHGAWLGKYVVTPDHLHAFVALDEERITLANWMKSLKNSLSKAMRAEKISSPHWQKTFFDHVLRSSESYSEKWEYVSENPVRAGLVKRSEDWPFRGEIFSLEYRSD
jgi:REP element-mobilizing transposase RayT